MSDFSLNVSTAPHVRTNDSTTSIMRNVLIALVPALLAGVYFFGFRSLIVVGVCVVSSVLFEYLFELILKRPVTIGDLSAAVTGMLLGLTLPVTAPWWMCVIGSGVAILLAKQLFGGIGDNFLNPALTARAVLLASWPVRMSGAAFVNPNLLGSVDSVSTATPLAYGAKLQAGGASILDLFLGNIPGTIGEVCKAAILLGFVYLLITHVISWHVPVIIVVTTGLCTWLFSGGGIETPLVAVLQGGILFGAVFMATDYSTCPMTALGQVIFAAGIGILTAVIRCFAGYPEGVTYAILFMNIVTPLLDKYIKPRIYGEPAKKKGGDSVA
ncbi:MAG: RnfABCDGE type electron transport complex subunit D [Clostridia bacterium]|nr:RnfABCDGE type electron transport complex subunit D [Clostridia bacterium]